MEQMEIMDPESWVEEHGDALFRYARFRIHDAQVAEDLVQETFLAALRARESFAGRSSVRTWLFGILKHKIIDHIRKISRERPANVPDSMETSLIDSFDESGGWNTQPAKWSTDPSLLLEQREFLEMLQHCLSELPPRLHQVFTMRELDGLSTEEICKTMDITPTNGGVMLHRARMRLRNCLETKWFDRAEGKEE